MRRRRRSGSSSSDAADRVLGLLGGPPAGWVPPPVPVGGPHPPPDAPATGERPDLPAPELSTPDLPAPDLTAADSPAPALPTADWPAPDLPALRRGRVDPGRRGAAALVVAALLAAVLTGGVVLRGRPQEVVVPRVVATGVPLPGAPGAPVAPGAPAAPAAPAAEVVVAVAGEVVRPGLVRLPAGSRVDDAVRAAGGPVAGADVGLLNLARRLVDGEQVLVGVDPPPGTAPAAPAAANGPVDLNTATVTDLDALPGIGPVLAQRIVDWRTEHGRFASVEQLREVTGIGERTYGELAAEVAVP